MNDTNVARRLGPGEAFYWMVDRVCTANFTVAARLSGAVDEGVLKGTLEKMPARHPLLKVRISDEPGGPVFRIDGVGEVPFSVMDTGPDEWAEHAASQVNEVFDWRRGPLARVVWLRHGGDESTMLVTFHHAVGDGVSAGFLIRDILAVLKGAIGAPNDTAASSFPPSLTEIIPEYTRGARGAVRYAREMARAARIMARRGRLRAVRPDRKADPRSLRAGIVPRFFDVDMTGRLIERAREKGTTVHGALAAAVLLAGIEDVSIERNALLALGSPVDMRGRVPTPIGETVGMYASVMGTLHVAGPNTHLWDLAREVTDRIREGFDRGMQYTWEPMTFEVMEFIRRLTGTDDRGAVRFTKCAVALFPSTGFALTNIGRVGGLNTGGGPRVRWVSLVPSVSAFAHSAWAAATAGGVLCLSLVYMEPLLSRPHAEGLMEGAASLLTAALEK
ncbi:MAG: hypothetical protein JW885_03620 [Deltaproteobacteria bacterium]|nr:hypothetical protein [Candidatus Zymogenaceae bacterium]